MVMLYACVCWVLAVCIAQEPSKLCTLDGGPFYSSCQDYTLQTPNFGFITCTLMP